MLKHKIYNVFFLNPPLTPLFLLCAVTKNPPYDDDPLYTYVREEQDQSHDNDA